MVVTVCRTETMIRQTIGIGLGMLLSTFIVANDNRRARHRSLQFVGFANAYIAFQRFT